VPLLNSLLCQLKQWFSVWTIWPSRGHTVFLGVHWSMKENSVFTVAFDWDTETLLTE